MHMGLWGPDSHPPVHSSLSYSWDPPARRCGGTGWWDQRDWTCPSLPGSGPSICHESCCSAWMKMGALFELKLINNCKHNLSYNEEIILSVICPAMKSRNDSEHSLSAYNGKKIIIVSIIFLRMEVWIKIEEYKFVNSIICLTEKLLWALFALWWRNNCIICLKNWRNNYCAEHFLTHWVLYDLGITLFLHTPLQQIHVSLANASGYMDK